MAISTTTASATTPESASWQDVGYRCPRPGFFLGDDGSMASTAVLAPCTGNPDNTTGLLSPSWDLGRLGVLPLELLHQIVDDLAESDVRALVALRNCNRAGAAVVESFRDFATVAAFPRALGALVRLAPEPVRNTAPPTTTTATSPSSSPVSLRTLAACLRTTACASCLRQREQNTDSDSDSSSDTDTPVPYGDYIYLLTPERVCYACFRSQPEYLPVARFASAGSGSGSGSEAPQPQEMLTSIRVPPGRYGVLARLTQPVDLFDRRQVYAAQEQNSDAKEGSDSTSQAASTRSLHMDRRIAGKRGLSPVSGKPSRPDPLRYAAVIPGPYWVREDEDKKLQFDLEAAATLDRGYACRACAQTDRKSAGHAGWADPLARYTRQGLQRHVADPRFGGRVLRRRTDSASGGAVIYEHDAPRRGHFPPPVEFGATADLARRYEAVILVPEGSVVGSSRR